MLCDMQDEMFVGLTSTKTLTRKDHRCGLSRVIGLKLIDSKGNRNTQKTCEMWIVVLNYDFTILMLFMHY